MLPKDETLWENFLRESTGEKIKVLSLEPISRDQTYAGGLGNTFFINLETKDGKKRVVAKIAREGFGREHPEDKARDALWVYRTSNLPRQPKAIAVGSIRGGRIIPLSSDSEYVVVLEEAEGRSYHLYLGDILKRGTITNDDRRAVLNLSDYLVEVHSEKKDLPLIYKRHVNELLSHEGIPAVDRHLWKILSKKQIKEKLGKEKNELRKDILELKKSAVEHVDRIEELTHRCSRVHGDYHPFENIRFKTYPDIFSVIDRSRSDYGEPADDVTAMWINYLNHSLLDEGKYSGKFRELGDLFLENYLTNTKDYEILETVQPFFVWRTLVVATPVWYPDTPIDVRNKLLSFAKNISKVERFDPKAVNTYLLD